MAFNSEEDIKNALIIYLKSSESQRFGQTVSNFMALLSGSSEVLIKSEVYDQYRNTWVGVTRDIFHLDYKAIRNPFWNE